MKREIRALATAVLAALSMLDFAAAAERWESVPPLPPMPAAAESGYAPVNGIKMYYAVYGQGSPILLIHGGLANGDYWANQVTALSKTHRGSSPIAAAMAARRATRSPWATA